MRRARGQATVELALGAIVFVGVLMAGIHLSEYAQLALKVQEAQAYAIWDAAGRRVQTRPLDGNTRLTPFYQTLDQTSGVGPMAQHRYADFDGLSGPSRGDLVSRALTEGSGVRVTCRREDTLRFRASPTARPMLNEAGGLSCAAEAEVRAINVPRNFLEGPGGFFRESIVRQEPMRVCGLGLPVNGHCEGRVGLLTNDWGLATEEEQVECRVLCRSSPYRAMTQRLWIGGGLMGRKFAARFAGDAPTDANEFQFSYSGIESDGYDFVGGEGIQTFITGGWGMGMVPQTKRPKCYLGKACP